MEQNQERKRQIKSMNCEVCFIIINQILNIILFFVNIGLGGNIYFIIFAILNSFCGLIFGIKYGETFFAIYNIIYIIVTCIIFILYHFF